MRERIAEIAQKVFAHRGGMDLDEQVFGESVEYHGEKIDSLKFIELINEIEMEFGINISGEELVGVRSINDLIAVVKRHTND